MQTGNKTLENKFISALQSEGLGHIVIQEIFSTLYNSSYRYDVMCAICYQHIKVEVGYGDYTKETEIPDILYEKIRYFAKQHMHEEAEINSFEKLNEYLKAKTTGYVSASMSQSTYDKYGESVVQIQLHCAYCNGVTLHSVKEGTEIKHIVPNAKEFAYKHRHVGEVNPIIVPMSEYKKNLKAYYPNPEKEYEKYQFTYTLKNSTEAYKPSGNINVLGNVTQVGSNNILSVSPEILKEVYKLSNFNVDLQGRTNGITVASYRAICSSCQASIQLNFQELISNNKLSGTWESLVVFCTEHKHNGAEHILETPSIGRRFKNVN